MYIHRFYRSNLSDINKKHYDYFPSSNRHIFRSINSHITSSELPFLLRRIQIDRLHFTLVSYSLSSARAISFRLHVRGREKFYDELLGQAFIQDIKTLQNFVKMKKYINNFVR